MKRERLLERLRARAAGGDPQVAETMNGTPCTIEAHREPMRAIAELCGSQRGGALSMPPPELLPPLP